jgi:ABC-2 type transport system permease protein
MLSMFGIMLPLELAPSWMKVASHFNPLTYVVDAERALFGGGFLDRDVLYGALAAVRPRPPVHPAIQRLPDEREWLS